MNYKVPEQSGKVFVVTGANTGIGRVTALELARAGAKRVILACRSQERTQPVLDEITEIYGGDAERVGFLALDLGDFESVRQCVATYGEVYGDERVDVLINNAGLAGKKGLTRQGFEMAFGVNHLGPFLFTLLMWEHLADDARIVNVASRAHKRVDGIDFDVVREEAKTPTGFPEYSVSKLANVLFSRELARRAKGTGKRSYALHPGVVASDVWREVPGVVRWVMKRFMITNEEGAMTTLYCATSEAASGQSGKYYSECKEKAPAKCGRDDALARELWDRSVSWVGVEVPEELG